MGSDFLPVGATVLVTGVNGYIASHIADQLLSRGYTVRGSARDEHKLKQIREALLSRHPKGQFEGTVIASLDDQSSLKAAVDGCAGIIHTAAEVSMNPDPNAVIPPSIDGMLNLLRAAAATPTVQRVVYTSSSTAAVRAAANTPGSIDATSWNKEDVDAAWAPPPYTADRGFATYSAAKVATEKAAWDFIASAKPSFTFNTVLPNYSTGPILAAFQPGSTAGWVRDLCRGDSDKTALLRSFPPQWFVDVRDVALIHVAALLRPDVQGSRLFAFAQRFNYTRLVETLEKINPSLTFPPALEGEGEDRFDIDNKSAEELLRSSGRKDGFRSFEESLRDQLAFTPI